MHTVYCLVERGGRRSYIGYTVNLTRRLRQHRGELSGGARSTRPWRDRVQLKGYITGFPHAREALRAEWHLKHWSRRQGWRGARRLTAFLTWAAQPRGSGLTCHLLNILCACCCVDAKTLENVYHLLFTQTFCFTTSSLSVLVGDMLVGETMT
jgi:predicted GIY-YIG superfamily endonuclease